MVAVCVTSSTAGAGKTTISAGLGRHLVNNGKRVGFLRPVSSGSDGGSADAAFMKHLLSLDESVEALAPAARNAADLTSAFARVSAGKDVVIVEGAQDQASLDIAGTLNAKVILVADYATELPKTIDEGKRLGSRLLGVVVNKVPQKRLEAVRSEAASLSEKAGVRVLGVLPEDRSLVALSVRELAELVHGKFVRGGERSDELVENIMLGALAVDPGPVYFARKVNKAVVVRSERPDQQLAALHTPTTCLVVAGSADVRPIVLQRATKDDVAVVAVADSVDSVVTRIEEALGKARLSQEKKLPVLDRLMQQHFDFAAVARGLGIGG